MQGLKLSCSLPLRGNTPPVECGFIQHVGEGGEACLGKKDTGYLYKAFTVARRPPQAWGSSSRASISFEMCGKFNTVLEEKD